MNVLPIPFSTPMVQAKRAGLKTNTRRIIKAHLDDRGLRFTNRWEDWHGSSVRCPYGASGDTLWVREEHLIWSEIKPGHSCETYYCQFKDGALITRYAKDLTLHTVRNLRKRKTLGKWQRARFLPKEFARIWSLITEIRVERLHDISEEDAIAEGIQPLAMSRSQINEMGQLYRDYSGPISLFNEGVSAIASYRSLWESINGPDSWKEKPWVWVVKFRVLSTTGRPANLEELCAAT